MNRGNEVPAIIEQMVETLYDRSIPQSVKHNYMLTLERVRNYCDAAIKDYNYKNNRKLRV